MRVDDYEVESTNGKSGLLRFDNGNLRGFHYLAWEKNLDSFREWIRRTRYTWEGK